MLFSHERKFEGVHPVVVYSCPLQIKHPPKQSTLTYNIMNRELCPVKIVYADIDSFIHEDTHYPLAIASYVVLNSQLAHMRQIKT